MGINNPLPSSMHSECKKAAKILTSFVDPGQAFSPDKVIPPAVLANAKGLAVLTVIKAGFLGSARFGSGVVVARLADGSWSAPSAIATAGGGFGGQIGFELTDFVFILNDAKAVKTFAQAGSLTLGGNASLAAGPVGRNAEAAGAASLKSVAAVFSYSKTKGLFAGVSLEGSVIIERKDANEKLYNRRVTALTLLEGGVPVPPSADPLMRVLNSRIFSGAGGSLRGTEVYNDVPVYDDSHEDVVWQGRRGSAYGEGERSHRGQAGDDYEYRDKPQRASTWQDDTYDRAPAAGVNRSFTGRANPSETFDRLESRPTGFGGKMKPPPPTAPKPVFGAKRASLGANQAIAKFTFDADQPGDLGFKKGEVITIVKKTENETDWWTGRIGDREGVFPRYAQPLQDFIIRVLMQAAITSKRYDRAVRHRRGGEPPPPRFPLSVLRFLIPVPYLFRSERVLPSMRHEREEESVKPRRLVFGTFLFYLNSNGVCWGLAFASLTGVYKLSFLLRQQSRNLMADPVRDCRRVAPFSPITSDIDYDFQCQQY
ncbi:DUF500-domain-containing protein [Eremomyces bilateralis CBS 781.70]|uniref:DUF500-domain-containing protein n=1 Tax=Eremomyces bilateralis CBS 781.70 TaxID=1392243 RepID=A0A6G1G5J7_9PEZI|nr:DUF500-domain-containing protein [Eremomyces bilateralis CBS 781.70]KAF1813333.1 DUF500-domain-containing protein [Eremomyces bilateralis CBS 781.70]